MRREALVAHLDAAARQTDHFAVARAIELLERARIFIESDEDLGRLEQALGDSYARDIRGDEAWEHFERAVEAFDRSGGVPMPLFIGMLEIRRRWGGFRVQPPEERMTALFARAEELARVTGDQASLARV